MAIAEDSEAGMFYLGGSHAALGITTSSTATLTSGRPINGYGFPAVERAGSVAW